MAMAKELMGGGFSAGQALAAGGTTLSLAATGSSQTDAATVTASMTTVTGADGTKGVILAGDIGDEIWVANSSASTLKVYPASGAAIWVPGTSAGSANTAYSQTLWAVACYKRVSATQYLVAKSA